MSWPIKSYLDWLKNSISNLRKVHKLIELTFLNGTLTFLIIQKNIYNGLIQKAQS